jgi:acetate---CoA ligase (ADP-forming)
MQERALYSHAQLRRLIEPASIAIVGASPREGAFGDRIIRNLAEYDGAIWPVNAKYNQIGDLPCYPSLSTLPSAPDCAILVVGRDSVAPIVAACAQAGAGGVIVCASGYAEVGRADRAEEQARLTAIARERGLPLIGPNCIGIVSTRHNSRPTFMALDPPPRAGRHAIGLVSQSGALGFALAQAAARGVAFSHVLCNGNSADVDVADLVAFLADSEDCAVIACVFEGMTQPRRMLRAAEHAFQRGKPLVVFKIATGEEGATAALSHTGSLAGSNAAYQAAFRRTGAVLVDGFEMLIETASFFAKIGMRAPTAQGVAILSTSGGAAIMAADSAEALGVKLPQPPADVVTTIAARIPEFGAARNPCDVTAQVLNDRDSVNVCAGALLGAAPYAALVVPQPYSYAPTAARIPIYDAIGAQHGKPVCMVWANEHLAGPGFAEAEQADNVAVFRSMTSCFAALATWLRRPAHDTADLMPLMDARASGAAARLIAQATRPVMTEREAKAALALYGVPVVSEERVTSSDDAVEAANRAGFPVVLKGESTTIVHKTEAGLVRLDLRDATAVRAAYAAIAAAGNGQLSGVLVQPMLPRGVEIVIGAKTDPQFGPLVMVGLGGVLVEVLRDTALAPAPVGPKEARAMLQRLRGARLLDGFRDLPAVDVGRLADIVSRVSMFAADQADLIDEMDINPLIATGDRIIAVDALIRRRVA